MQKIIFGIVSLLGCATSNAPAVNMDPYTGASQFLRNLIEEQKTPGLQYILVDPDRVLFSYHGGFVDLKKKIPVTESTTFNGYSITKTFTAAAVVKLAQQGKIDLDAPISSYLTDFPYKKSPTVRQTLQHTAGFPNPNPLPWIHRAEDHAKFDEQAFLHQVIHENPELAFSPGEKFAYSNVGYLLLGEVIHRVGKKPYHEYVRDEIIAPLSLADKNHISFTIEKSESHALGYIRRLYWLNFFLGWFIDRNRYLGSPADGWVPFHHLYVNGRAYGGLVGNAGGFATYLQAMLGERAPFNRDMLGQLWKVGTTDGGKPIRTGLAWFHGTLNGHSYFAHSGGAGGYYCEIRIYPELKRASVIMTNNTGISNQKYLDRIDSFFLSEGLL